MKPVNVLKSPRVRMSSTGVKSKQKPKPSAPPSKSNKNLHLQKTNKLTVFNNEKLHNLNQRIAPSKKKIKTSKIVVQKSDRKHQKQQQAKQQQVTDSQIKSSIKIDLEGELDDSQDQYFSNKSNPDQLGLRETCISQGMSKKALLKQKQIKQTKLKNNGKLLRSTGKKRMLSNKKGNHPYQAHLQKVSSSHLKGSTSNLIKNSSNSKLKTSNRLTDSNNKAIRITSSTSTNKKYSSKEKGHGQQQLQGIRKSILSSSKRLSSSTSKGSKQQNNKKTTSGNKVIATNKLISNKPKVKTNPSSMKQQKMIITPQQEAQLEQLKQQNQKYKQFLMSSAFKVQQLKKQISQSKQIRQTEKNFYNFQLGNLKKQVDTNKRDIGHLYSYDQYNGNTFLPQQIIIETDNQSSSIKNSQNMVSKVSKNLLSDQNIKELPSDQLSKSKGSHKQKGSSEQPDSSEGKDQLGLSSTCQLLLLSSMNKVPSGSQAQKSNKLIPEKDTD